VESSDSKSIFGVLVGLFALFLLWLWASGNAAQLWAVVSGTPAPSTSTTAKPTSTVATTTPIAGSPIQTGITVPTYQTPQLTTVATPTQYINTSPAITAPSPQSIGGLTFAGAQSGGVQITPSVFANSSSVPAAPAITYSQTPTQQGLQTASNWLQNVLDPLGIGGGAPAEANASWGTYGDLSTADNSAWGSYNDTSNLAGTSADTGTAVA
jgi:hypothetical protein